MRNTGIKRNSRIALALATACGGVTGLAHQAHAQPYVVNTFGATLLTNLLTGQQVNNDYIDCDGDGNATRLNGNPDRLTQLLNTTVPSSGFLPGNYFVHQYRSIGSVNGLQELVDWGCQAALATDTNSNSIIEPFERFAGVRSGEDQFCPGMRTDAANPATVNATNYIVNGVGSGLFFNNSNPGSIPFRSSTDGLYTVSAWQPNGTPSAGGTQNDAAPIDVPTLWGVTKGTSASALWSRRPDQTGYGKNARNSRNRQGGSAGADLSPQLVNLPAGFNLYDGNPANANSKTIFDTQIAWAPIPNYANYGTGISQLTYTQCQHLYVTGRLPSGENLMVITRDTGSGTHNGHMNSLGIDPSWGVGENIGPVNNLANNQTLGPNWIPGNKGSSSSLEATLRNARLGIGYSGGERFQNNSIWQYAELIAIGNDLGGRTPDFVRPTVDTILDNGLRGELDNSLTAANRPRTVNPSGTSPADRALLSDGYRLGGKAIFATMGDPRQTSAADGGYGFEAGEVNPGTPPMCNLRAAEWLNNISRSIDVFDRLVSPTPPPSTDFSPGEFVAQQLFPLPGTDQRQTTAGGGTVFAITDSGIGYNDTLQTFLRTNGNNAYVIGAARYATYGFSDPTLNGRVPNRQAGIVYSDNAPGVSEVNYLLQDGTIEVGGDRGTAFESRNRIAGDFNNDGLRNINDADDMIKAWRQRNGGPVWGAPNGGGKASIEILGDFSGDGNFGRVWNGTAFVPDRMDVRYWADGLAIAVSGPNAGKVDRKAGFTAVDNAFLANGGGSNNFFGTTKATGTPYNAGDSRGDVANVLGFTTPGFLPIGADGNDGIPNANDNRIDAHDVDYVSRQINTAADRAVNWGTNLNEAAVADLSADMTGDLVIDCNDINELVVVILGTQITDLNLDGVTDGADLTIATANLGTLNAVWSQGDVDCDGAVTAADLALIGGGGGPVCDSIDFNNDGLFPDTLDVDDFLSVFGGGPCSNDPDCNDIDFNNDGLFPDTADIDSLLSVFGGGPCL